MQTLDRFNDFNYSRKAEKSDRRIMFPSIVRPFDKAFLVRLRLYNFLYIRLYQGIYNFAVVKYLLIETDARWTLKIKFYIQSEKRKTPKTA